MLDYHENTAILFLNELVSQNNALRILEAGCGSIQHMMFDKAHIVGIDISKEQLKRNVYINESIHADIQKVDLRNRDFDLVVCWDVLEHVMYPLEAVGNLILSMKKGGYLFIRAPNPFSLWGLVTKFSPQFCHKAFYRYVLKKSNDLGLFETKMRVSMCPSDIIDFSKRRNCEIIYLDVFESRMQEKVLSRYRITDLVRKVLKRFFYKLMLSSYIVILRKAS